MDEGKINPSYHEEIKDNNDSTGNRSIEYDNGPPVVDRARNTIKSYVEAKNVTTKYSTKNFNNPIALPLEGNPSDHVKPDLANNGTSEGSNRQQQAQKDVEDFDHHHYATKKTVSNTFQDIGLLSSNANVLKHCLQLGPDRQEYYLLLLTMTSISIILQVVAGIMHLFIAKGTVGKSHTTAAVKEHVRTVLLNDVATGLVFLITVINILISTFGMMEPR